MKDGIITYVVTRHRLNKMWRTRALSDRISIQARFWRVNGPFPGSWTPSKRLLFAMTLGFAITKALMIKYFNSPFIYNLDAHTLSLIESDVFSPSPAELI